jgi:hypothetical protein
VTARDPRDAARLRAAVAVILLTSAILLTLVFGGADSFDADALICLAAIPLVVFLVNRSSTAGVLSWLMTPVGALLGFLWLSVLTVPILWALGLATPWIAYPVDQSTRIVATAIGAVALIHAGSLSAGSPSRPTTPMSWRSRSGLRGSLFGGVALILVCFAILQVKVGVFFLLGNLLTKRDLLAGLGPLTAAAACTGVAGLAAWSTRDLLRSEKLLATACSLGYLTYLFVLGSRLPMIAYVTAISIARASAGRIPRALVASVGLGSIPFAVWYSVIIRKGQLISDSGAGWLAAARSLIDPFVYGGLDVLNTFGAVVTSTVSDVSVHLNLLLANATTMLPRSLWPGKPPGVSVLFSERFFERQWLDGSGVPPSIIAELLFVFGVVGGLMALPILGFVLSRVSSVLAISTRPFLRLIYPFVTVDCIFLAKSGTDAFLQQLSIHIFAMFGFIVLSTVMGAGPQVERSGAGPQIERSKEQCEQTQASGG